MKRFKVWKHMRVKPTKFGGKEAADEREEALFQKIRPTVNTSVSLVDDYVPPPEPWEHSKEGGRGSFGDLLLTAIRDGKVKVEGVTLPVDAKDAEPIKRAVDEVAAALVAKIPWVRWHKMRMTASGLDVSVDETGIFALVSEVESWGLSPESMDFLKKFGGFERDRDLPTVHRLTLGSLQRASNQAFYELERKARPKVVRIDPEAEIEKALAKRA